MRENLWRQLQKSLKATPPAVEVAHTQAAVLVGVLDQKPPAVLLTRRSPHLKDHAGQIAFPGGRVEAGETFLETALREAQEEVGLNPHSVEVLGFLPLLVTGTGFAIVPVVAKIAPPFDFQADDFEVAEIFSVPLDFLMDERNHKRQRILIEKEMRTFWAMPYQDYFIWGATAHILRNLWESVFQKQ